MKKRALMALPKLTATDEMKQIATSDLPRKEKTDYGYVREVCEYYTYLRCIRTYNFGLTALHYCLMCGIA